MKPPTKCFWAGFFACIGLNMARQDFYGLEAYIEMVRTGWVELSPAWGVLIAMYAMSRYVKVLTAYMQQEKSYESE